MPLKQSASNDKKSEFTDQQQQQIAALEKQLAELRGQFDAGKLSSEPYLKKKIALEKKIAQLKEKAAAARLKQSEGDSPEKGSAVKQKTESAHKGKTMSSFNKRYLIIAAAVIVMGLAIWGIVSWISGSTTGFDIGMRAPSFSFQTDTTKASLNDFKGKQVVLTFWDRQESCKEEASVLKEATVAVSFDKTAVLIVNGGSDAAITGDCIKNQGITLPVLPDPRRDITRLYGVNNIPKTFFIDEAGMIAHVRFGSLAGKGDIEAALKTTGTDTVKKSAVISNVNISSLTQANAIVTWTSNATGSGSVTITDGKQMRMLTEAAVTTNHMVAFGSLTAGTVYSVKITIRDTAGKEYSTEGYSFRTLRDITPPIIQDAKASQIAANSITVTWATDEAATGQVEFGETTVYGGTTTIDAMLTTSHSVSVSGLKSETVYYLRVKSKDAQGNEAKIDLPMVTTKSIYTSGAEVGKKAPDFSLLGIDGKTVQLSALKGKIVILQFFNTECRTCVTEMPLIRKMYREWQDKGLQIFAITKETHIANLQMFANIYQLTFPILMDPDEKVVEAYQVPFTPYFVFIDGDGVIRNINEGRFTNEDDLTQTLNSLFYTGSSAPKKPAAGTP